ncbi:TPA: hypothetical protein DEO28_04780 [Candidatus Dependentiae bacterium]|nr:MAG: hypothetical protein UR14_C0002G0070 [candidate division TM6 bacterium GW2011_GWE2_31_21]KKP53867.1 MAG: hypothetical protein UR43_C0002G0070 [candidate division TM6 bacterium GW2011_GWF2_33_332]HBS47647.1 hypothetical protein [Candidatus Dependentiae bacterium]HBZ73796.1 hypothetical protein [Candidatus Dependentiae bacterium]
MIKRIFALLFLFFLFFAATQSVNAGLSPLHVAIVNFNYNEFKQLIENGADVNAVEEDSGISVLDFAIRFFRLDQGINKTIFQGFFYINLLIDHGATAIAEKESLQHYLDNRERVSYTLRANDYR